ncbi:hypothetical protein [Ornithinimicrobium tianjinense]|uniref:hypothetical protein n=1 Tax=Ornithinimicrobium tianjinense TaxID=1195761 RepID=UPI00166CD657|nr:hypothetical protein [Ornithinimicrobium tianjinense]
MDAGAAVEGWPAGAESVEVGATVEGRQAGAEVSSPAELSRRRVGQPASRARQVRRQQIGRELADRHAGMARRADLLARGLTDHDITAEVGRGVWQRVGVHSLCIDGRAPTGEGRLWWALWESGPRAVLDGASALIAAGLRSWTEDQVHVTVPRNASYRRLAGVRHHVLRDVGATITVGLRRTRPEVAAVRAAEWARSDREAATLLAMTVQQRLVATAALLTMWERVGRSRRRTVLDGVIKDICDGAHSINELDVGGVCRAAGLPEPSRQVVRTGPGGRVYLDLFWDDLEVHAEIQGAHHFVGLKVVEDAARQNDLAIASRDLISLQIPVIGWRLHQDRFLRQIGAALEEGRRRRAAREMGA